MEDHIAFICAIGMTLIGFAQGQTYGQESVWSCIDKVGVEDCRVLQGR